RDLGLVDRARRGLHVVGLVHVAELDEEGADARLQVPDRGVQRRRVTAREVRQRREVELRARVARLDPVERLLRVRDVGRGGLLRLLERALRVARGELRLLEAGLRAREVLLRGRERGLQVGRVELRERLAGGHRLTGRHVHLGEASAGLEREARLAGRADRARDAHGLRHAAARHGRRPQLRLRCRAVGSRDHRDPAGRRGDEHQYDDAPGPRRDVAWKIHASTPPPTRRADTTAPSEYATTARSVSGPIAGICHTRYSSVAPMSAIAGAGIVDPKRASARGRKIASPSRHAAAEKPTASTTSRKTRMTPNAARPSCSAAGTPKGPPRAFVATYPR